MHFYVTLRPRVGQFLLFVHLFVVGVFFFFFWGGEGNMSTALDTIVTHFILH